MRSLRGVANALNAKTLPSLLEYYETRPELARYTVEQELPRMTYAVRTASGEVHRGAAAIRAHHETLTLTLTLPLPLTLTLTLPLTLPLTLTRFLRQDISHAAGMTGQIGTPGWTAPEVFKFSSYDHKVWASCS